MLNKILFQNKSAQLSYRKKKIKMTHSFMEIYNKKRKIHRG